MNHKFVNFKVIELMMQLKRPVFVIFSVDLECMWDFSAFVRELLCYHGLQVCLTRAAAVLGIIAFSCPILLDQFPNRNTSSRTSIRLCVQMCCVVQFGYHWIVQLFTELAVLNRWCFCEEPSAPSRCVLKDHKKAKGNLSLLLHLKLKAESVNPSSSFKVVQVARFSK